jgi:hypothetical protein
MQLAGTHAGDHRAGARARSSAVPWPSGSGVRPSATWSGTGCARHPVPPCLLDQLLTLRPATGGRPGGYATRPGGGSGTMARCHPRSPSPPRPPLASGSASANTSGGPPLPASRCPSAAASPTSMANWTAARSCPYAGSARLWGFAVCLASRDGYQDPVLLASGLPTGAPQGGVGLRLQALPGRPQHLVRSHHAVAKRPLKGPPDASQPTAPAGGVPGS